MKRIFTWRWNWPIFCLVGFLLLPLSVKAGGGPEGYLVVYNPNDPRSVTIANYYQQVRHIPERNMAPYVMPSSGAGWLFTRTTAWDMVYALRQAIANNGLGPQLQGIALAGIVPLSASQVPPDAYAGSIYSIQSFLYLSPNYSEASFPASLQKYNPAYAFPSNFNGPPPMGTIALAACTVFSNQPTPSGKATVWPVSSIGYPGLSGNSLREILSFIDRAKAHDGVKPAGGTIYWPLNSDIRSTTREFEIKDVEDVWNARGIPFIVTGNGNLYQNYWVTNRTDIQGGMVGTIGCTDEGNTYLPGAWVDHLTSFGAEMDQYYNSMNMGQLTCSHWLRMGVDGTAGAVAEPYADSDKFPHANIHTHLRAGASLAEAFWESIAFPAEIFCLGDPLLQPFASFPAVTVATPTNGAIVSGILAITAAATPTGGQTLQSNLDLFIDGRRIAIGSAGETVNVSPAPGGFSLDTTTLADGWHEIRVVAYNADAVHTQNEQRLGVVVNNLGQSIALTGTNSVNPNGSASFTLTPSGLSDLTSLVLQANGRVLASLPVTGGTTILNGTNAPLAGNWMLYAIGTRANGRQVWSAPFSADVSWPTLAPTNNPPLGNAMADVRVFNSTTNSSFSWDTTTPDVVTPFYGSTNGIFLTPSNFSPFLGFTNPSVTHPGWEMKFWFYAPTDDWYEFAMDGYWGGYFKEQWVVDGQTNAQFSYENWGINHLAPGWHQVRARAVNTSGGSVSYTSTQLTLRERGGVSQDYVFFDPATTCNTDTNSSPAADQPVIVSLAPSASPVTGTGVTLTTQTTIGNGSSNALAGLKVFWTLLSAPSNTVFTTVYNGSPTNKVSFSTNGGF